MIVKGLNHIEGQQILKKRTKSLIFLIRIYYLNYFFSFITIRLCLFWLKRISGNPFTPACMFGKHRKLGQTEINFRVDWKITSHTRKSISGFILPLNDFHPRKIEEREKQQDRIVG